MSVNLNKRQNVGILAALVVGAIVVIVTGLMWLESPLIEDVVYVLIIVIATLVLYDKLLVQ